MAFPEQDAKDSDTYAEGATNALEVTDRGSAIAFVNVHALSLNHTDCAHSKILTEIS